MVLLVLSCIVLVFVTAFGQSPTTSPSPSPNLVDILTPTFIPINEAARALFPATIRNFETPIAIRSVLLNAVSRYEIAAACHPTALSFFGVKDPIPKEFCQPLPRIIITSYINFRLNLVNFPLEAGPYGEFLIKYGLQPFNETTDQSTLIGWANTIASRANEYFINDGWNSVGTVMRSKFPRPYFDTTGYVPVNPADIPVDILPRPLRWQPLTQSTGFTGQYRAQTHTVPHLAKAKTLVLSKRDLRRRAVQGPYSSPNRRSISARDMRKVKSFIDEYFEISRNLTPETRFLASWWDNKFVSVGAFLTIFNILLDFDSFIYDYLFLSETMAQHDAVIVAWKEKIRHDLVRPTTLIRQVMSGEQVQAFINEDVGVGLVDAGEYESYVTTQPHSEFPSASTLVCVATFEYLEFGLKQIFGKNFEIPRFFFVARPDMFSTIELTEEVTLNFSLSEALESCGQSRLWAGVHFSPSVKAGEKLGKGIGKKTFLQVAALVRGEVPADCWRCKNKA